MTERSSRARVVRVEHVPPRFRERPPMLFDEYTTFGRSGTTQPTVYIHDRTFYDLVADGARALPKETIGLLYGRSWQDAAGRWMVINRYVTAQPMEKSCSPVRSSLTAEGNASLRRRAELLVPAEECLGWAHTHTFCEPEFSSGDFGEQARKSVESVGLLAYRAEDEVVWRFSVYLGPTAEQLGSAEPLAIHAVSDGLPSTPVDRISGPSGGRPPRAAVVSRTSRRGPKSVSAPEKPESRARPSVAKTVSGWSPSTEHAARSQRRPQVRPAGLPPRTQPLYMLRSAGQHALPPSGRPSRILRMVAFIAALVFAVALLAAGLVGDEERLWASRPFLFSIAVVLTAFALLAPLVMLALPQRRRSVPWARSVRAPAAGQPGRIPGRSGHSRPKR